MRGRIGERGFSTVAALAALILFGFTAAEVTTTARSATHAVNAEVARARLRAAADAGLATAIHGLGLENRALRWAIDGRPYPRRFGDIDLAIHIEDERGKLPVNFLSDDRALLLFELTANTPEQVDTLIDSFLDWRDEDDTPRPLGAEAGYYAASGIRPANGGLRSVDDLAVLRGMTPDVFRRIRPALTIFAGSARLSASTANPLALAIVNSSGVEGPEAIQRARELAGQRTALDIAENIDLVGRPLTIVVSASDRQGGRLTRATVIELTGRRNPGYVVRYAEQRL